MSDKRDMPRQLQTNDQAGQPILGRTEVGSEIDMSGPSKEPPKSQIDFQFLNFSHPSDAKGSKARKTVRSHVTKHQHQREHANQAARRAKSFQGSAPAPDLTPSQRPHAATDPPQRSTTLIPPASTTSSVTSSPEQSSASPSASGSPLYPPERRVDPYEVYHPAWHESVHKVVEHSTRLMAVDIPGQTEEATLLMVHTRYFPFVMSDLAPLHAFVLVAASIHDKKYGPRSHSIDLLQLRGMAIGEINAALEDDVRATSDQIIAAVATMAAYEALFGDRLIFNTHMTGLLRMVSLRGGLPALGLDGLLEATLLWIDANAAHITRSHLYFDKAAFPTTATHPRPDPLRFAGGT